MTIKKVTICALLLYLHVAMGAMVLKSFVGSYTQTGNSDGTGANAKFGGPRGMVLNPVTGTLYVADQNANSIRQVSMLGEVSTLYVNGQRFNSSLQPYGVALDTEHNRLYVSNAVGTIESIDLSQPGYPATTILPASTTFPGDPFTSFMSPTGLFYNTATKTLYFSEKTISCLRSWSYPFTSTSTITTIWANPYTGYASWSFVFDASGAAYIGKNYQLMKVLASGSNTAIAGAFTQGYQDGPGTTAKFGNVEGLAWTDATQTSIYVVDQGNSLIRKVDISTGYTSTAAGVQGSRIFVDNSTFADCAEIYAHPLIPNFFFIADNFGVRVWYSSPPQISNLNAVYVPSKNAYILTWTFITPFPAVTGYKLYVKSQVFTVGQVSSIQFTPQDGGSEYNFTVVAQNEFGVSPPIHGYAKASASSGSSQSSSPSTSYVWLVGLFLGLGVVAGIGALVYTKKLGVIVQPIVAFASKSKHRYSKVNVLEDDETEKFIDNNENTYDFQNNNDNRGGIFDGEEEDAQII